MRGYRDSYEVLAPAGTVVLGISPQDIESHQRWIEKEGFQFPLLADVDKGVGTKFGVVGPPFGYRRSVFIVDGAGVVRWKTVKLVGATWPKAAALAKTIEKVVRTV